MTRRSRPSRPRRLHLRDVLGLHDDQRPTPRLGHACPVYCSHVRGVPPSSPAVSKMSPTVVWSSMSTASKSGATILQDRSVMRGLKRDGVRNTLQERAYQPWPARTCRPRSEGGAAALRLAARSAYGVRSEALRAPPRRRTVCVRRPSVRRPDHYRRGAAQHTHYNPLHVAIRGSMGTVPMVESTSNGV